MRACVATWSTCQRACVKVWFTCLRDKVPKACQLLISTCQHTNKRAKVPCGVPIFQTFLLRNAKRNFYTLLFCRKYRHSDFNEHVLLLKNSYSFEKK